MSGDNDKIIEAGVKLTDTQRQSITEGVQWVKDWYEKRHEVGMFLDGADVGIDVQEYQTAMQNLDNLNIVATNDIFGSIEKMIKEGKLHLKDEVVAQFGGDESKAIEALLIVNQQKKENPSYAKAAGLHLNYVKEPVLFLNVDLLEKESQNVYAPSLSSTVAHEVTHTLGLQLNEMMTEEILNSGALRAGVKPDTYLDNPKEVYARVKEFCKSMNIDPTKEIKIEDIQRIRDECEKKRADYEKNGGSVPKDLDHHLFDRYTDDKLVDLINCTAMNEQFRTDTYDSFRSTAKADLAFSQHKISKAEKDVANVYGKEQAKGMENKTLSDDVVQQVMRDSRQYS